MQGSISGRDARGNVTFISKAKGLVMRFANISTCAAALGAAILLGGCSTGAGGSSASDQMATGGPSVAETGGNIAIQAGATEAMKKGGLGGSIGYGLQSHGSNLSKALFGKKKAAPKTGVTQTASK